VLAALVSTVLACGGIDIDNAPSSLTCGAAPLQLSWNYSDPGSLMPGDPVDVSLWEEKDFGSNVMITDFGSVAYPTSTMTISWPGQWPMSWITADSDVANDGSQTNVYIYISGPNGDVDTQSSDVFGTVCITRFKFEMSCCPTGSACSGGTCSNQMCVPTGSTPVPGAAPTPVGAPPTPLPAGAMTTCNGPCASGNTCSQNGCGVPMVESSACICVAGNGAPTPPVASPGTACTPGTMQLPAGGGSGGISACSGTIANPQPLLACVAGKCAACAVGTADCSCNASQCSAVGYICSSGRCVPNTGCMNCPCTSGECNSGLICLNNMCSTNPTPPPTPKPAVTAACPAGSMNCPCLTTSAGTGCTSPTLTCKNGVCSAAVHQFTVAVLAAIVALFALLI